MISDVATFFDKVASAQEWTPASGVSWIVVTHMLSDRRAFLPALEMVAPIEQVVCVPYSVNEDVARELAAKFSLMFPSLDELRNPNFMRKIIERTDHRSLILDIGGYFAFLQDRPNDDMGDKVVGVVEDTEAGHRLYLGRSAFRTPVYSVARSPLKTPEDLLVGASSAFSIERLRRDRGAILDAKCCLVLGFGKVGKGMASALRARHMRVLVFDTDPTRRIEALASGFAIPERRIALQLADVIVGATGLRSIEFDDLAYLKDRALLLSTSSKDVEFPIAAIRANLERISNLSDIETWQVEGKRFSIAYEGRPVNFRDGAAMGPFLALTQAEMISCGAELLRSNVGPGLVELGTATRNAIANTWLEVFLEQGGSFAH